MFTIFTWFLQERNNKNKGIFLKGQRRRPSPRNYSYVLNMFQRERKKCVANPYSEN